MAEQNQTKPKFRTSIGGQALIEGILMRGPEKQAIVVRSKEGLVEKVEELKLIRDRYPILGLPVLRGAVTFVDSMVRGVKALMYSADFFPEEEGEPSKLDLWLEKKLGSEKLQKLVVALAVVLSLGLTIGLFMILPTFLAGLLGRFIPNVVVHNLVESVIKLLIFFGYPVSYTHLDVYKRQAAHRAQAGRFPLPHDTGTEETGKRPDPSGVLLL